MASARAQALLHAGRSHSSQHTSKSIIIRRPSCRDADTPCRSRQLPAAQRRRLSASGRDWLQPTADELDDWQGRRGTGYSSSSDEDDSDTDLDLFPEEAGSDPEFVIENVLATALIALAAIAVGIIALKLLVVLYSLVSAAVRYTVIGLALAVGLTAIMPGRWWF